MLDHHFCKTGAGAGTAGGDAVKPYSGSGGLGVISNITRMSTMYAGGGGSDKKVAPI